MSALGQKQTYAVQHGMSALPPIATSIAFLVNVAFADAVLADDRLLLSPCRLRRALDWMFTGTHWLVPFHKKPASRVGGWSYLFVSVCDSFSNRSHSLSNARSNTYQSQILSKRVSSWGLAISVPLKVKGRDCGPVADARCAGEFRYPTALPVIRCRTIFSALM